MRYLLCGFAIFGTLIVSLLAAAFVHGFVDRVTCAPGLYWSGTCYDLAARPMLVIYENFSVAFVCLSVGGMAIYSSVGLSRASVIRASYVVGAFMLVLATIPFGRYDLAATGLSFGLVVGVFLHRKYVQNAANHSLQARPP